MGVMMPRTRRRPPLQHPDPVLPLEAGLGLLPRVAGDALVRALVDERPLLRRHGGHPDAPLLVVDADAVDAFLGADVAMMRRTPSASFRSMPSWAARCMSRPCRRRRGRPGPRAGRAGGRGSAGRRARGCAAAPSPSPRPMRTARRLQGRRRLATEAAGSWRRLLAPHGDRRDQGRGGAFAAAATSSGSSTFGMIGRNRTARPKAATPSPTSIRVMIASPTTGT